MTQEPEPPAEDLELRIFNVGAADNGDGSYRILIFTDRGEIEGIMHPYEGGTGAVIFISGGMGGLDGPADKIYARLSRDLLARGVTSLRLNYRRPSAFNDSLLDTLAGASFLRGIGAERLVIVGHSFGGAVAIKAGQLAQGVTGVVAMSSQLYGTRQVEQLAPKALLLVHGTHDQVLEMAASQDIYDRALEPKRMVLYEGAGHGLFECRNELYDLLMEWIPQQLAETEGDITNSDAP